MAIEFRPVRLHGASPDDEGMLAFRQQRLFAVLAKLSNIHEGNEGQWFVETVFGSQPLPTNRVFADLRAAEVWMDRLPE